MKFKLSCSVKGTINHVSKYWRKYFQIIIMTKDLDPEKEEKE